MAILLDIEEEEDGQLSVIKRKRKRKGETQRKLLAGAIVEIRSKEEGFDGSWHPATVIDYDDLRRQVRYMHLLVDDDSDDRLIEWINVSCMIDGVIPNNGVIPANYRGVIRPVPHFCNINPWSLGYGLCVDAFVKEAWWEGVIFDHEDGENERSVFFPDLGDTLMVKIENLRITHDWNEVREDWTIRGDWLFLELVEKHEEELGWFSPVSVRQLWYNLRSKKAFKSGIKEWTCWDAASTWDGLVLEVIHDNINLYAELYLPVIESEVAMNVIGCPNEVASTSTAAKFASPVNFIEHPCKRARSRTNDVINSECAVNVMEGPCKRTRSRSTSKSEATLPWRGILHDHVQQNHPALIQLEAPKENYLKCKSDSREVVDTSIDSDPPLLSQISSTTEDREDLTDENFPDATASHLPSSEKKDRAKFRSKIVSLGWNIISYRDQYALRTKYMSPEGKPFYSLVQVRKYLNETKGNTRTRCFPHVSKGSGQVSVKSLDSNGQTDTSSKNLHKHYGSEEEPGALDVMSPGLDPLVLETREVEGANAVLDYYGLGPKAKDDGLCIKAKKYLLDKGWKIWYANRVTFCTSPNGKKYNSLRTACRGFVSDGFFGQMQISMGKDSKEDLLLQNGKPEKNCTSTSGWSQPREFKSIKIQFKKFRGLRRRRKNNLSLTTMLFQSRAYPTQKGMDRVLIKKGVNLDNTSPSRVPRSNKRARQVVPSNPEHFTPRTILSWLIDNNVVLPRAKVQYRNRKNQPVMAEGKITRDGIKCNCCQKVFAITNFVTHAGGKSAANIFLEDGRSLLECQKQVQDSELIGLSSDPYQRIKSNFLPVKNDCICSVCHYGGTLVLCDQCPSAFHQSCIGLEKLPQGKWFCPSCRCEICGKSETNGNISEFTEKTIIYCDQCEREFHVGCLREMRMMKLESCPKEKWCCSTTCETIYTGLHNLLGRSTAVGVDNLSWTILKSVKDGYGRDAYNTEIMTEHQSKLNVALSVLHECFEPIKEPQTNDLVKDVVFNKRSTLKRLNFQGFYTVLLEKEDELISVATVRVYGGKVAEIPLVGTRVQYRRQGMCRILMNLLEKKLEEFGVQRLLLPAIPQVLQAWTTAFGFSKMTESERLKYLEYTFLDFQGTTMCQKILKMVPTLKIIGPREIQHELEDEGNDTNGDAAVDRDNIVSSEAKPIQQSDILKQISFKVTNDDENSTLEMVSSDIVSKQELWGIVAESADTQKENEDLESKCSKYYSRRKNIARYSCDPISLPVAIQQTSLNVSDMRGIRGTCT